MRLAAAAFLISAIGAGSASAPVVTGPAAVGQSAGERCYTQGARTGCVINAPAGASAGSASTKPLLVYLHGYGGNGRDDVLGIAAEAQRAGFLFAFAEGTGDPRGNRTWATIDATATGRPSPVDDVAFLDWLVASIQRDWNLKPGRVVLAGHSLGGFMAQRYACERADKVNAVLSWSGGMATQQMACAPSRPVSVLLVHGSADTNIKYAGGTGPRTGLIYDSAQAAFAHWAAADGCKGTPAEPLDLLDLDAAIPSAETRTVEHAACAEKTSVALWTIDGGGHRPVPTASGSGAVVRWLLKHARR